MNTLSFMGILVSALMLAGCAHHSAKTDPASLTFHMGASGLPEGFAYVSDVAPQLDIRLAYAQDNNIIGKKLKGYDKDSAVLTEKAAKALLRADNNFRKQGYALVLYDAYRPRSAHAEFYAWAQDLSDESTKPHFYPNMDKKRILAESFLSALTEHSRGSTVDVSLKSLKTGKLLDMGGHHDLIAEKTYTQSPLISSQQAQNRALLLKGLAKVGFSNYPTEWWHYTLVNEPYPDWYWDFPMKRQSTSDSSMNKAKKP